jgi:hypothetical protein
MTLSTADKVRLREMTDRRRRELGIEDDSGPVHISVVLRELLVARGIIPADREGAA